MNKIQNSPTISFRATVSEPIKHQIERQVKLCDPKRKIQKMIDEKMQNVAEWGYEDAEIVKCKNSIGKYSLGLRIRMPGGMYLSWFFEHLNGKTELSQFLNLHETHILKAQDTIKFLYKKYGVDVFKKHL